MTEVSFGEWLKRQRMGRGLTRERLAHQIGCAVITLRKIEAEERHPSIEIVQRLAEILNIPQDQNTAFLRFARGDWLSAPTGAMQDYPWLTSPAVERKADDVAQPAVHLATFLFTDIEGSAKLWDQDPEKMKAALQRHHAVLQDAISSKGGQVFQIVGDAFCAVFPTVHSAIAAAVQAQLVLFQEQWDTPFPIRVRMGIHTGEAEHSPNSPLLGGYASNQSLNRVARILSAAHGGQILLSLATTDLVKDSLPANTDLRDMGEHHLRNLIHPEHLFQLNIAGLPSEFPPLNTLDSAHHNLPVQLTSFIGRESDIARVEEKLTQHRLVTLVGPGGVGKTRLSLKDGEQALENYANGVWFVELAPILDPVLVPRTVAIAIGLRDEPQRPVIDMLCDYLREKKMLILLDNCEHLLEACAQLADTLLKNCPNLNILATSREALGILGEAMYHLPPLGLPDTQQLPETFRDYESVRLFEERAQLAQMDFSLTPENALSIAQICICLDGIPLAIELAAARVNMFSTAQIAIRLQESFNLLTIGNRTALERHQTLRAAIDWSYNLLSPAEQILFRRLSVFVGGWTLEAAESVCSDESVSGPVRSDDVLNILEHLINKSMIIAEVTEHHTRYRVLETVRQYAHEKLVESGKSDALRDKHLEYFLNLAETADPYLRRAEQIEWLKRLDAEHDNLRAALAWAMDKPSAEPVLRLAGNLGTFWLMRSYGLEGAKWLDQALGRTWNEQSDAEKAVRAKVLYRRADIATQELDELDIMKTSAESALALCEEVDDHWGIVYSRMRVADYYWRMGMSEVPIKLLFEQILIEFQKLDDVWGEAWALGFLAILLVATEPREEFFELNGQAIACARLAGDRDLIAFLLAMVRGTGLMFDEKWDEAESVLTEAQHLHEEIDSVGGINDIRFQRTRIFFARGNLEKAKAEAKLLIEHYDRSGEKNFQSQLLFILALIAEAENDLLTGVLYAERSLTLKLIIGVAPDIALGLILVGILQSKQENRDVAIQSLREGLDFVQRGEVDNAILVNIFDYLAGLFLEKKTQTAIQILALSESLAQSSAVRRNPVTDKPYFDRYLAVARAKLSEAEFTSAWEDGSKMTLQEIIDLALKTLEENDTLERGQS